MQITHEEAHTLIQLDIDRALDLKRETVLSTHLKDCADCRAYAKEVEELESTLSSAMQRHWSVQPLPLPISILVGKRNPPVTRVLLAMRTALISALCVAFVLSAWQVMTSKTPAVSPMPVGILPVPTPSPDSTSTKLVRENCEAILYTVQEADTLSSIAQQFSVPEEEIMAFNHMKRTTITATMKLRIPLCNRTPTGTAEGSAAWTTTYTPVHSPTTSTPGG